MINVPNSHNFQLDSYMYELKIFKLIKDAKTIFSEEYRPDGCSVDRCSFSRTCCAGAFCSATV